MAGIEVGGVWNDNYGGWASIDPIRWGGFKIKQYDNDENWAVTQNAFNSGFSPSAYNLVVWTEPGDDGSWWTCTVAFGLATAEEAVAAEDTSDDTDPSVGGCGGFAWTEMTPRSPIELGGVYNDNYGGWTPIAADSWGANSIKLYNNDENWLVVQYLGEDTNGNGLLDLDEDANGNGILDPGEDANDNGELDAGEDLNENGVLDPGEDANGNGVIDVSEDANENGELDPSFSRVVWTEPDADGVWWTCTVAYGLATVDDAVAAEDTSDASDPANGGCGGFSWTQMTPRDAIEIAGLFDDNFGGSAYISGGYWGYKQIHDFDNEANWVLTQNANDDEWDPQSYSKTVWTEPAADGTWFTCTIAYGLDSVEAARDAEDTSDDTDPANAGCGGFGWTLMTPAQ